MKLLLVIVILGLFALVGSQLSYFNRRVSIGFRNIVLTGIEYIFAGILLGGLGLNILDSESVFSLQPLLTFGMCWVGSLLGLQLNFRELKKMARHYFTITTITTLTVFITVTAALVSIIGLVTRTPVREKWLIALVLAAISCNTAQSALAILSKNYRFKDYHIIKLLRYMSGVDGIFAILLFSLAIALFPPQSFTGAGSGVDWAGMAKTFALSLGIGLLAGLVLYFLARCRFTHNEFILYLVGVTLFFGGLSTTANLSPLFTGLLCGTFFANICQKRMQALSVVIQSEKAIYIIMLLLLGAIWNFSLDGVFPLALGYLFFRTLGKNAGAFLGSRLFPHAARVPPWLGMGLLSEGGLSIVLVLNFKLLYPVLSDPVVSILVFSAILNELISPSLIMSLFSKTDCEIRKRRISRPG